MKKVSYSTTGSVRGCCGHKHRTIDSAVTCIEKDQPGVPDRVVILTVMSFVMTVRHCRKKNRTK